MKTQEPKHMLGFFLWDGQRRTKATIPCNCDIGHDHLVLPGHLNPLPPEKSVEDQRHE